jgi:hypothetical protein
VARTSRDSTPLADSTFGIFLPNPALAGETHRWALPSSDAGFLNVLILQREGFMPNMHIVFQILDDLGASSDAIFEKTIARLTPQEAESLLDRMDDWYGSHMETMYGLSQDSTMFTLWVPKQYTAPEAHLSAQLILADRVIADDPLYHLLMHLTWGENFLGDTEISRRIGRFQERVTKRKIIEVAKFYKKAKDLIDENRFVPFFDNYSADYMVLMTPELQKVFSEDPNIKAMGRNIENLQTRLTPDNFAMGIGRELLDSLLNKNSTVNSLAYLLLSPRYIAPSIDLLEQQSSQTLRHILTQLSRSKESGLPKTKLAPFSQNSLELPTLKNVPIERVTAVSERKKESIASFKAELLSRVAKISSPLGSDEWEREIIAIRFETQKDLLSLKKALEHEQGNLLRAVSADVLLLSFSVALAGLAFSGQQVNTLSMLQSVAAGAGLISGLKGLSERWLEHKKQVDKLKEHNLYFLWELSEETKR